MSSPCKDTRASTLPATVMGGRKSRLSIERPPVPGPPWEVNVTIHMAPTLAAMSDFERKLGQQAAVHLGRADGWFCERITSHEA